MKIVVLTAITADRDSLKEAQNTSGADFVAFCDRPHVSKTWDIRPACDLFRDPVRNAKIHKILPHLFFPEYDYSLWIDGTLELADPAPLLVERHLAGYEAVFGQHPVHRSLSDETEACEREVLDDPAIVRSQLAAETTDKSGDAFPLASAILRRHTENVARFNTAWWAAICRWSRRDQLSLLKAATEIKLSWTLFPRAAELEKHPTQRLLGSPHFRWYPHGYGLSTETVAGSPIAPAGEEEWLRRRLAFVEAVSGQRESYALSLEAERSRQAQRADEAERYARNLEEKLQKFRQATSR